MQSFFANQRLSPRIKVLVSALIRGLWLGICLSLSWGTAEVFPQLSVQDDSQAFLASGSTLSPDEFVDAQGQATTLPMQGRYLLWIANGDMALETRERVPAAEFMPLAPESASFFNLTAIVERFAMEPGYVVFYQRQLGFIPDDSERAETAERFAPYSVLFDEDGRIPMWREDGSRTRPDGLYLIEDGVVQYRYLISRSWPEGFEPLVREGVQAFLAGEAPAVYPLPLLAPGTSLPEGFLNEDRPALLIQVSGQVAEVPPGDLRVQREEHSDGGYTATVRGDHPAASHRFMLDELTPFLARHQLQGVALVTSYTERLPELAASFPEWHFIALELENAEEQVRWRELLEWASSMLIVDGEGKVQRPLRISAAPEARGLGVLETALRRVAEGR